MYGSRAYTRVAIGRAVPYEIIPLLEYFARLIITTSNKAIHVPKAIERNEKFPIFQLIE
jgi:hypothetical protein